MTLLAFLVLIVVSLALLTRVETQASFSQQQVEQARLNALFALNVALGQLQKYAGPDPRITGRAELSSLPASGQNPYFTAVWDAQDSSAEPLVLLISGSEQPGTTAAALLSEAPSPTDDVVSAGEIFLLGNASVAAVPGAPTIDEKKRRIKLALQPILVPAGAAPGAASTATPVTGRYAWWIGDLGIKASLALPDRADEVTYAPWSTPMQRHRIRQQLGSGPNYFRDPSAITSAPKEGFDPFTVTALSRVTMSSQFGYIAPATGSLPAFARTHYHDFTPLTQGVLANTRTDAHRGLMHDLSLNPDLLGPAYARYANPAAYMEIPGTTVVAADPAHPAILDADSPRRRYRLMPALSAPSAVGLPDIAFNVSPVLADFILQFRVFRPAANRVSVRSRLYAGLWNPYTAALVIPTTDELSLEITGLPEITISDVTSGASIPIHLQNTLATPLRGASGQMRVTLPFGNDKTTEGTRADRSSWLPGRMYAWATESGDSAQASLRFYDKNMNKTGWDYPSTTLVGPAGNGQLAVKSATVPGLTIVLRTTAGILATYTSPDFRALDIPPSGESWKFAFAFRLKQPSSEHKDRSWLKTCDPRNPSPPASIFGGFDPNQDITPLDPSLYTGTPITAQPAFLLYRIQGGSTSTLAQSSYNDVPLFELPRLPLLSLGELQHLPLAGKRPFSPGNSWGESAGALFDRFFFSGLPRGGASSTAGLPDLAQSQPLPNWNLRPIGTTNIETVRDHDNPLSSRHLLQAGAFNVNSTSAAAWRALLSSVRLTRPFEPADIDHTPGDTFGTQKNPSALSSESFAHDPSLGGGKPSPLFFRFPQSAQETYAWKTATGTGDKRLFGTSAFRLGVRGLNDSSSTTPAVAATLTSQQLTTDQIETLAREIVGLIKIRAAGRGPFRSLEEFIGPSAAGAPSLLETAIEKAAINPADVSPLDTVADFASAGWSSSTLTQADLLTGLAPYLRTRSDTFVVRTYGEIVNPATAVVGGRAWLEATVQRVPEPVDPADPSIAQPTGVFGRRFKIIAFQWLSSSDI